MKPHRTLVVFSGAIGDLLLAGPALRTLASESLVDLVVPPDRAPLAVAAGMARQTHTIESVQFHTAYTEPSPRLREFLHLFQRCIVWLGEDPTLEQNLTRCGIQHVESHPGKPPQNWTRHATEFYADRLNLMTAGPFTIDIAPARNNHDVVIHPGSGSRSKNWPIENFIEAAGLLKEAGRSVAWSFGPAEHDANLATALPTQIDILPDQSLVERAAVLSSANAYVGNDSGITHLAAAVGCPTLALFGPTNSDVWAPRGSHVRVYPDMGNVNPHKVAEWAMKTRKDRRDST